MERKEVELTWSTKRDILDRVSAIRSVNLPFQVVETINESKATRDAKKKQGLQKTLYEVWSNGEGATFESGWKNKLIWGDNKHVMSSLLRKFEGKIDLIYIDPPFATGDDFYISISVDNNLINKEPTAIEQKAYRDTWGRGMESYLDMIYERLYLMHLLLSEEGSIFVHVDSHVGHYVKVLMDEIFGKQNFKNEIIWYFYNKMQGNVNRFATNHNVIYWYTKSSKYYFAKITEKRDEKIKQLKRVWSKEKQSLVNARDEKGNLIYIETDEKTVDDVWRLSMLQPADRTENLRFNTQKPEALLERIIRAGSRENALVADFFCGSGTALAVAEKLGRRWIGADLGRFAIHTSRKRLMEIENCKPFEILNLGKYERQIWQETSFTQGKQTILYEYFSFILKLYGAEPIAGFQQIHGRKGKAVVHIGSVDAPVTIDEASSAIEECKIARQTELHVLGWEWEMGIHDLIEKEARQTGVKLRLLTIPNEVMETSAVEKGDIVFFDLAYVKADILRNGKTVQVELQDFVIPNTELVPEDIRAKISRWSDLIDYWAIDFDFHNDTFMNSWTAYRTKHNPKLTLKSDPHAYQKHGKYKVVVKVIDIFGIDTSQVFEVEV